MQSLLLEIDKGRCDLGIPSPDLRWGKIIPQGNLQMHFYDSATDC